MYRTPPPWSHLDTLTPDAWHGTRYGEKDTIRTDSVKSEQKSDVKNWHLSLAKRRKADEPESLQRAPSPTPTLVNPPSPTPTLRPPRLFSRGCLSEVPDGGSASGTQATSDLSQNKSDKLPQPYKRPRLKLEPDSIISVASQNNQDRSTFKRGLPGIGSRGHDGKTSRPATEKSSTIQKLYERKSGTSSKTEITPKTSEASKCRSTPDCAVKRSAKVTHSGKPKSSFDWKGWSGNLKC